MNTLHYPTPDDSLIMFHLRSMGFAGGWKTKEKIQEWIKQELQANNPVEKKDASNK